MSAVPNRQSGERETGLAKESSKRAAFCVALSLRPQRNPRFFLPPSCGCLIYWRRYANSCISRPRIFASTKKSPYLPAPRLCRQSCHKTLQWPQLEKGFGTAVPNRQSSAGNCLERGLFTCTGKGSPDRANSTIREHHTATSNPPTGPGLYDQPSIDQIDRV